MSYGFLRHVASCTRHDPSRFVPFSIEGRVLGAVRRDFAPLLAGLEGFAVAPDSVALTGTSKEARTQALARATALLSAHHGVPPVGEIYPVLEEWDEESLAEIDRAAIPWLGTRGFGVHVNGYVPKKDGLHLWIAKRAADRRIDPGKLDNMIGGGLPLGYSVRDNLAKEAWEEAGLAPDIAQKARAAGSLRYKTDMMKGVRNDSLFVFDLEMPEGLAPRNTDGEVESFTLAPAAEVAELIAATDRFKFNCNLVTIDFLLRHGAIAPDHPEYEPLTAAFAKFRSRV